MKLSSLLLPENVYLNRDFKEKEEILRFAAEKFHEGGMEGDWEDTLERFQSRELIMSTGLGRGVAVPHAATPGVRGARALLVRLKEGVDFEALDGLPVRVVVALLVDERDRDLHLRLLAGMARLIKSTPFGDNMLAARDPKDLLERLESLENRLAFP